MIVAEYVAKFLKKKVNDLFMLTGYGAMYLNDAIAKENIKYFDGIFKIYKSLATDKINESNHITP